MVDAPVPLSVLIGIAFGVAFGVSLAILPLSRRLGLHLGWVAQPRQDRWHRQPTPVLGGVGIYLAFALSLLIGAVWFRLPAADASDGWLGAGSLTDWGFLAGSTCMFLLGLYDDIRPLSPATKLVGQIIAATLVVAMGYTSTFFTPRLQDPLIAQIPNILFTYLWLIGITNAINLLDNMDGLAGGIALITSAVLAFFFWRSGSPTFLWACLALAGGLAGFLIFNFPPARLFMGDSGSLFLGFTLAVLAITHQKQQASNVLAVIAVPTLLFMLPILDTGLVMFTRLLRGQSPVEGGRDHASHRLVAFGLSERQVLLALYIVASVSAVLAASLESLNYWLSLALVPLLMISLALLTAYLGRVKVIASPDAGRRNRLIADWMEALTYRRRVLEALLDFGLIALAYYLAFLAHYGLVMNAARLQLYLQTLPLALAGGYFAFFISGVYRVVWRYSDFDDLICYLQAAAGSLILPAALIFIFRSTDLAPWQGGFPRLILILFSVFILLGLVGTRLSFRLLDRLIGQSRRADEQNVLILGAGDSGELAARWIRSHPELSYRPIGFLLDNPLLNGRSIHGIRVLGSSEDLAEVLRRRRVDGIILAGLSADQVLTEPMLQKICQEGGCWVRRWSVDFELLPKRIW